MLLERGEHGRGAEHVDADRPDRIRRGLRGDGHACEMHDRVRTRARERALDVLEARDVTFVDTDAIAHSDEIRERRALVRETVDLVAARYETLGEMASREAGDPGDEHSEHDGIVPRMVP
jgi:acyl-CoA reductase-like NAD-dependent aldehyde dehydrogenase